MKNSESILIVEDESIIALMEQQTLQSYGFSVYIAADRDSAIKIVRGKQQIDLILMDIDLGENGPDGTEVAREILSFCHIPVIFLSSHSDPEIVSKTEKITSYGYIVKGCNDTILLASIKMAFKLHKSNAYLRTLLEASPDGIWVSDKDGKILDVNRTYCNISGYAKDELIGKFISEIDSESSYNEVAARVRELKQGETLNISTTHLKKNGDPLFVEASIARINLDSEPEIVTFSRDCTEEQRLSENIAEVEQKFENIVGSIQDAVFTLDLNMRITGVYGPWVQRHGADSDALTGMRFTDGMEEMGARFDESVFHNALDHGYSVFETEIETPFGRNHFQISFSRMKNEHGKAAGVIGIGRNITELMAVREDLKAREKLYSSLLKQVPGAIYQYRYFSDGRSCFPFSSQNIELVYEVTPEEVRDDASLVFSRLHPDDSDGVVESIMKSRDELSVWEHDYRVVLPSKGIRWLRGRATPEELDDGSVLWCGFITDITDLKDVENKLFGQKDLLQRTLRSIGDAVITTDLDGHITDLNKSAADLTGWKTDDALDLPLSEVFDVIKPVGTAPEDVRSSSELGTATILNAKDGRQCRILDSAAPIIGMGGGVEGAVVVFRDITEKYEKAKQLESTVQQLQSVIDATGVGTWKWNVQTGEVTINGRWAEMLGFTTEELSPVSIETWKSLAHPGDLEKSNAALADHFKKDSGFYECEVRVKHRNGDWVWILDRGSVLTRTEDGSPEWVYGTHLDITERKLLEAETRKNELQYRTLFENLEMGFALHDVVRDENNNIIDFKYTEVNESFGLMTGLYPSRILHRRISDVIPDIEKDSVDWISRYAKVVETGKPVQFENFSTLSNKWYSVTAYRPLPEMLAALFYDTTENRKMILEKEKALNNQQVLMKELNHRVKNNLLMVKSLIHLKNVEAGDGTDLGDIESRVQAIADLHEELQNTSRPDRVPLHSYISRIVETVIENNTQPIELVLDAAELEVSTRLAVSVGLIINEIVTNAIKHGFKEESNPRLEIKSRIDGSEGFVRIANNGRPFPADLDLDNPQSLGLRLVTTLAKQIKGSISVIRMPHPVFTVHFRI